MKPAHPELQFRDLVGSAGSVGLFDMLSDSSVLQVLNGRSALYHLATWLKCSGRHRVLLPAFHCVSVATPFVSAGLHVDYYRVDKSLSFDPIDIVENVSDDTAAVLFINYFGLMAPFEPVLEEVRRRGALVIEDCSHSFLLNNPIRLAGMRGDAAIYSFWKLLPSTHGGGLWVSEKRSFSAPTVIPRSISASVVDIKRMLEQAIMNLGPESRIASAYALLERTRVVMRRRSAAVGVSTASEGAGCAGFDIQSAYARPPLISQRVLGAANLNSVVVSRVRNYRAYARNLTNSRFIMPLFRELPDEICPWAFPVLVPQRCMHDWRLRELGIPVWTFGNELHESLSSCQSPIAVSDARFLQNSLLCLPVHQMLEDSDILNFCESLNRYFSELESNEI